MNEAFYHFLKAAIKNPMQLSTAFQTSDRVGQTFAQKVSALNLAKEHHVVELGVGAGAITQHLVPVLSKPEQYIGFELNKDLHRFSTQRFANLEIANTSAENLSQVLNGRQVGAVISTLPWSLLPKPTRKTVLDEVYNNLQSGGLFVVFLAIHVLWTRSVRDFLSEFRARFPNQVCQDEYLNMPPCRLFFARK